MLDHDRIDVTEGSDVNQRDASKEFDSCHYWYFLDKSFNYEPYIWNVCHDLMNKNYEL